MWKSLSLDGLRVAREVEKPFYIQADNFDAHFPVTNHRGDNTSELQHCTFAAMHVFPSNTDPSAFTKEAQEEFYANRGSANSTFKLSSIAATEIQLKHARAAQILHVASIIIHHHPSLADDINPSPNFRSRLLARLQGDFVKLPCAEISPPEKSIRIPVPAMPINIGSTSGLSKLCDYLRETLCKTPTAKYEKPFFLCGDYLTHFLVGRSRIERATELNYMFRLSNFHSTASWFHYELNNNLRFISLYYGSKPHANIASLHTVQMLIRGITINTAKIPFYPTENLISTALAAKVLNRCR